MKSLQYYLEYWKAVFRAIRFQMWLRSKGVHVGIINKSTFRVKPRLGDPEAFRQAMLKHSRTTREFHVLEGADAPKPVTKIGGQPWWPVGIPRPVCRWGHDMNFIAQILLADIPLPDMPSKTLLSFHYCDRCSSDGRMPGCFDEDKGAYDLAIFENADNQDADMKGNAAPPLTKSYHISFRDIEEVPGDPCEDAKIEIVDQPKDYPQNKGEFDEVVYPGLKHVSKSKLGGWPTWAQSAQWPLDEEGNKYDFVGQLDWDLFTGTCWSGGGYAYLFITRDQNEKLKAELVIQVT